MSDFSGFELVDENEFKQKEVHKEEHLEQPKEQNAFLDDFEELNFAEDMKESQQEANIEKNQKKQQLIESQKQEAIDVYEHHVAKLEDTAKLGKKQTEMFKKDKELRKKHNARIDQAKLLTKRATSDTLSIYENIRKVKNDFDERKKENDDLAFTGREFEDEVLAEIAEKVMALDKEAFKSSMIRNNFTEYYKIICDFDYVSSVAEQKEEYFKNIVERYRPVVEALRKRLNVYCEQNRIRLDGSVMGELDDASKMLTKDMDAWERTLGLLQHQNSPEYQEEAKKLADEKRLEFRERKSEKARPQATSRPAMLTREESMKTESDLKSQKKRDELREMCFTLYNMGQKELAETIQNYVTGTRYVVGYTEERERLKTAMKAVEKLLSKKDLDADTRSYVQGIQKYFAEVTNGTLQIPEDAKILDCRDEDWVEDNMNDWHAGKKRSKLLNYSTHWSDQTDAPLFSHEPVVNDLKQRLVSNCYMLAATAGIVNVSPELLKDCVKDNGDGTVTVRLYEKSVRLGELKKNDYGNMRKERITEHKPVYIRVKKTVPRLNGTSADALSAGALWMQMIEKACAFYGRRTMATIKDVGEKEEVMSKGYRSLWYGAGYEFVERLLGSAGMQVSVTDHEDDLFQEFCNLQNTKKVYSTGSPEDAKKGLDSKHAYSIIGAQEINGVRYVKMRNPYSNHSMQYDKKGNRSKAGGLTPFSNGSDDTYGQFLMKYDEFLDEFKFIFVNDLKKQTDDLNK